MNYYSEIKNELINNEINRTIKNYSINKNGTSDYYSDDIINGTGLTTFAKCSSIIVLSRTVNA